MPPAVIDAMASFRTAIDAQEVTQSRRMARAWLEISRGLDTEFERLARDVGNAAAAGRGSSFWHISRMDRYQSLLGQILTQQRRFEPIAANDIAQTQALLGRWSVAHASQLITMQRPAIAGQFDRLPVEAITNMVGNAGDGTPLGDLLRQSWGDEGIRVGNVLVRGTALGWNPIKTARAMRDEVNITLEKAMLIGRTEQMRVYRETSRQQYLTSRVVEGYIRVAAKSIRTCMACLMADGQFYLLSVPFEEHPNGRCTSLPKLFGVSPVSYETGEQWFARQPLATQRTMMGPGRYQAWQEGRFALSDLVTTHQNDTWGNSLQVTPLRVLAARPAGSVARSIVSPVPTLPPPPPVPPPPPYVLKYQPSAHQQAVVDQHVGDQIRRYAINNGMTEADVRSTLERVLNELVENVPISRRQDYSYFDSIMRSGRFMSQFETGTSEGALTPTGRANAEFKGLGYPLNVDAKERPIYGFFNINQSPAGASWYGHLEFVFKEDVKRRSTFTVGDSLGNFAYDLVYGAPVKSPTIGAADHYVSELMEYARSGDKSRLIGHISYVEAQMQNGVQLGDVEYVIDHRKELKAADVSLLQGLGIGVR